MKRATEAMLQADLTLTEAVRGEHDEIIPPSPALKLLALQAPVHAKYTVRIRILFRMEQESLCY
jgi:hypothetical protein